MKFKLLCALACSFFACSASAEQGEVRVTEYNATYMSVLDVDTAMPVKGYRWAWTAVYLAEPKVGLAAYEDVDYMASWGEYDCSSPGRWRVMTMLGYASGKKDPVTEDRGQIKSWARADVDSPAYYSWLAVCNNTFTDKVSPAGLGLPIFHSSQSRQSVLNRYREILRSGRPPVR